MITPKDLKLKCQKYWNAEHIQRGVLARENLFPLTIAKIRFTARELNEDFSSIKEALKLLQAHSKDQKGFGYTIRYQTIQHRQLGRQSIPESIVFETLQDFLKFSALSETYRLFCDTAEKIVSTIPSLSAWLKAHTAKVLAFQTVWPKLLAVALFLQAHPKPNCYLRELPIPDIDSKFIEQHKGILRELLDLLLLPQAIHSEVHTFQNHGFERRYGFKYPEPLIRFRILDSALFQSNLADISLPLSAFQNLNLPCDYIIITENKINGLSFPNIEGSIIIFGLGYGIQSLAGISWLQEKIIYYWGDIDTHGFAMLSQLRAYYPKVKNLLMDETTLQTFKTMATSEPNDKRCLANLPNLTATEQTLYQALCQNSYGKNLRIEQERIDFKFVKERLKQIFVM